MTSYVLWRGHTADWDGPPLEGHHSVCREAVMADGERDGSTFCHPACPILMRDGPAAVLNDEKYASELGYKRL